MEHKFFVTTPIYYVNDKPHIGHAYTTIAADILARFYRSKDFDVFFLIGTDEHGAKVQRSAKKANLEPQEFVDQISAEYQKVWKDLNISNDEFIRTTQEKHIKYSQDFIQKLKDKGDIYSGKYKGLYCVSCEEYKKEADLSDDNICPVHQQKCEILSEKVWFFKLSKYEAKVKEAIEKDQIKIRPIERKNEVLSFLNQGLQDIAISRSKVSWGIPLPWDKSQTIYVWFEALLNYLSAGEKYWPADLQILGKDILRFHAVIWPAMLIAAKFELPKEIFVHGYFTIAGKKISKTLGNIITPNQVIEKFGVDAARYLIISEFPFGNDGDVSIEKFQQRYNAELANGLGNLTQRVLTLCVNSKIQISNVKKIPKSKFSNIQNKLKQLDFTGYVGEINKIIQECNQKIDKNKPWELEAGSKELNQFLSEILEKIQLIGELFKPIMPQTAEKIEKQLKTLKPVPLFQRKL
jgi:methionyl-tRNA synthetase